MATGEMVGAIAMTEPGTGSDLQGVRTSAKKSGNGYVLNGSKIFITNGQHADLILVVAKTDPSAGAKGVSLMVVETADAPGFRRGRKLKKLGLDSIRHLRTVLRGRETAGREPARPAGRTGLRPADAAIAAGAADRWHPRGVDDGARACG